jgi:hypothetical protein
MDALGYQTLDEIPFEDEAQLPLGWDQSTLCL